MFLYLSNIDEVIFSIVLYLASSFWNLLANFNILLFDKNSVVFFIILSTTWESEVVFLWAKNSLLFMELFLSLFFLSHLYNLFLKGVLITQFCVLWVLMIVLFLSLYLSFVLFEIELVPKHLFFLLFILFLLNFLQFKASTTFSNEASLFIELSYKYLLHFL